MHKTKVLTVVSISELLDALFRWQDLTPQSGNLLRAEDGELASRTCGGGDRATDRPKATLRRFDVRKPTISNHGCSKPCSQFLASHSFFCVCCGSYPLTTPGITSTSSKSWCARAFGPRLTSSFRACPKRGLDERRRLTCSSYAALLSRTTRSAAP